MGIWGHIWGIWGWVFSQICPVLFQSAISAQGTVHRLYAVTIAPYIGFGPLFGAPRVQIPPRGFRPIANRTSFSASSSWVSAGCDHHLHISAMSKRKNAADAMRALAREVRQDASFCGIFEMCVWCRMRKVGLLLAFGVTIINVLPHFGKDLKGFKTTKPTKWWLGG